MRAWCRLMFWLGGRCAGLISPCASLRHTSPLHPPPLQQRAVFWRAHKRAVQDARAAFRKRHPPWVECDRCMETFAFPSQWRAHASRGCRPKYVRGVVEAVPPVRRWMVQEEWDFAAAQADARAKANAEHVARERQRRRDYNGDSDDSG